MVSGTDVGTRNIRRAAHILTLLLCCVTALGCSTGASSSASPPTSAAAFYPYLGATNGTAVPLTVRINGGEAHSLGADGQLQLTVAALPPPPWHVVASTPSDRVVLVLDVPAADVWRPRPTGEGQEIRSDAAFVFLSCGRVDLFYGPQALGPMAPSPAGSPGDCD